MPPQVAARMASVATKSKTSAKSEKEQAAPAEVPSSAEKLGAHGAKVKHKRRFCRIEGCERIVKSQGLCQRHGAKPRLCKVKGCSKQAQGNFDGKTSSLVCFGPRRVGENAVGWSLTMLIGAVFDSSSLYSNSSAFSP